MNNRNRCHEPSLLSKPIIFIGSGRCGSTIISECLLSHHSLGGPTNYVEWFPKTVVTGLLNRLTDNAFWKLDGVKGQLNPTLPLNSLIPRPAEAWSFWQNVTRSELDFSVIFCSTNALRKKKN
ncbi:hypothetical protein [Vibrio sonorensis]|uniref:hypothetical protein n=1 Tax=Vibrio sonorensis TaxID=1004316 RepID=UPI001113FF16|nr:hypothetical protein [Vibrio sonorensis]